MTTETYRSPDTIRYNVSMQNFTCYPAVMCYKRAMRECVEFWAIELAWFIYCCVGNWSPDQPLRIASLLLGCVQTSIENIYRGRGKRTVSMFMTYILGRTHIRRDREGILKGAAVVVWMGMSFSALFVKKMVWINAVYEGTLVVFLLGYLISLALALQPRGRKRWLPKLVAITVWGGGWGFAAALYWQLGGDGMLLVVWFMLYEALFAREPLCQAPREAPPVLNSPWLRSIERSRSKKNIKRNARCVDCGDTFLQATCLWEVYHAFWCTKCYLSTFQVCSARGIFCIKGPANVPTVPMADCLAIEAGSELVCTTASEASALPMDYPDGILYRTYKRMWRKQDGTRFSKTHLGDGRFLTVGPGIRNDRELVRETTSQETQTEFGSSWHWDYDCFLKELTRDPPNRPEGPPVLTPEVLPPVALVTEDISSDEDLDDDGSAVAERMAKEVEEKMMETAKPPSAQHPAAEKNKGKRASDDAPPGSKVAVMKSPGKPSDQMEDLVVVSVSEDEDLFA